jgi:hypothetical protein
MPRETIIPESEESLSVLKRESAILLKLSENKIAAICDLMVNTPESFSTSRINQPLP